MKTAIYPGTFDPITYGHLDIIARASRLFSKIVITVASNPSKAPLFTAEERVSLIKQSISKIKYESTLEVETFDGLIVKFAKKKNASAIIRGLRAISDFEFEFQMALMNRRLLQEITTVFLMPHENYTYLNSSIVKEVASLGGDISNFVPLEVEKELQSKFSTNK